MVVFISGISFAGYILVKWFGEKGIEMTGIFGGLVSSTAVATSFAERSKKEKSIVWALALGVVLANGIIVANDSPRKLVNHPEARRLYFGEDFTSF